MPTSNAFENQQRMLATDTPTTLLAVAMTHYELPGLGLDGRNVDLVQIDAPFRSYLTSARARNRNVYFSPKRSIREQQIASRRVWEAQPSVSKSIAAQDVLPDELKAAIILFFSLLDERERRVYAGLESLKLGYGGDRQMAEILGLDVSTVARGCRELLEHDVNVERVRKAGAGRKAVEKKRQKSSRRSKNL